jgi:Mrp family chromosome partitioning ATPase/capsular polysaccharide biosynthesis protein
MSVRSDEQLNVYGLPVSTNVDSEYAPMSGRTSTRPSVAEQGSPPDGPDGLREYLAVIGRHKLAVVLSVLATTLAAFLYSVNQNPLYESSASVLVTSGGAASVLSDIPGIAPSDDPARFAATQIGLARLPVVARRTVEAAGLKESAGAFLGRSSVAPQSDADILQFTVNDGLADRVAGLATTYARQFTQYRNELDVQAIRSTRASVAQTLSQLARQGQQNSALYAQLSQDLRRLDAAEALHGSAAVLVQPAVGVTQIKPQTKRNVALGLILGLIYGLALAFLIERLDTRVRNAEQVETSLGMRALGELPEPPKSKDGRSSMLNLPHGPYAEGVRTLRANFEFVTAGSPPRTLMVTSAVAGEGKTTVAVDLAVALARSGRSVALCDLDARAPRLGGALGLDQRLRRGLVDVVIDGDQLDRVLVPVSWSTAPEQLDAEMSGDSVVPERWKPVGSRGEKSAPAKSVGAEEEGQLHVLTFGSRRPSDPGDFVGSSAVRRVIEQLAAKHDVVIIDTPPLLPVSDARAISEHVDAALIVCGLKTTRRRNLRSLRKILAILPAPVLGVVVTGVAPIPGYGYYGDAAALSRGQRDHGRLDRASQ